MLLGCYRTGDANDPDTYVAAVTAILSRYPQEVVTSVTHPATGLPSKKNWLPTVREVCEACDEAMEPIKQRRLRENRIREQLASRDHDRSDRPTYEQLQVKYGKDWGITDHRPQNNPSFKAPNAEELRAHYSEFGLRFQCKEEISDSETT